MTQEHKVILCIGSNVVDRCSRVREAALYLSGILENVEFTHPYETPERDGADILYYNSVVAGYYKGDFNSLSNILKEYELMHGRDDDARNRGDVPIDIDIVIWDGEILRPNDYQSAFFQKGFKSISAQK